MTLDKILVLRFGVISQSVNTCWLGQLCVLDSLWVLWHLLLRRCHRCVKSGSSVRQHDKTTLLPLNTKATDRLTSIIFKYGVNISNLGVSCLYIDWRELAQSLSWRSSCQRRTQQTQRVVFLLVSVCFFKYIYLAEDLIYYLIVRRSSSHSLFIPVLVVNVLFERDVDTNTTRRLAPGKVDMYPYAKAS